MLAQDEEREIPQFSLSFQTQWEVAGGLQLPQQRQRLPEKGPVAHILLKTPYPLRCAYSGSQTYCALGSQRGGSRQVLRPQRLWPHRPENSALIGFLKDRETLSNLFRWWDMVQSEDFELGLWNWLTRLEAAHKGENEQSHVPLRWLPHSR